MGWCMVANRAGVTARPSQLAVLAIFMIIGAPGLAQDEPLSHEVDFQIAAQSLSRAIIEFSDQARIQVLSSGSEVSHVLTKGVRGPHRVADALHDLLDGTGLKFHVLNQSTVSIAVARRDTGPGLDLKGMERAAALVGVPPPRQATQELALESIVVTATRIIRGGYEAPTPTTVMGIDALSALAVINIADAVNALPALVGGATPRTGNSGVSSGQSGTNTLDLRSMGANRTLVLLDGVRVVPIALTGVVDINHFPDGLIQRIEVVTGGASAVYGSDAMTGVINFILDKDFTGFKTDVMAGLTSRGENEQIRLSMTAGMPFASDRGHFLFNAGYGNTAGIRGVPRSWYRGWKVLHNPAYSPTNGQPQLLLRPESAMSVSTPGALVTAGPLRGTEFGVGGAIRHFEFGPVVSDPIMSGGDWRVSDRSRTPDLEAEVRRQSLFARADYRLSDDLGVFAQLSYSYSETDNQCCWNYYLGNITIQRDNAFLPESIRERMDALGLASLLLGSSNQDLGAIHAYSERTVKRYVAGVEGESDAFGAQWRWNAYVQRGISDISNNVSSAMTARYREAIDAVRDGNGRIVCRAALTNPDTGCVPYNVLGIGVNSQSAVDHVRGTARLSQQLTQDVAALTVQGEPFSTWAGPISVATGAEYRKESAVSSVDPIAQANGFFVANFKATQGSYDVIESFLETVVPLAGAVSWAKSLDLNGAMRWTDYSASGEVVTWKLGATYSPTRNLTFRGTRSRDIRAPNLNDLFLAGQVNRQTVNDPFRDNATTSILRPQVGNPTLDPEKADTLGLGLVYQPAFAPGLSMSVDYYRIDVADAIATIQQQAIIDRCHHGNTTLCSAIVRDTNGAVTQVTVKPVNLLSETAEGLDFDLSYRMPWRNGRLSFHALATHVLERSIDDGIVVTQLAGDNSGSAPSWRWLAMLGFERGAFAVNLIGRGVSRGLLENAYIQCAMDCPAATTVQRTIDNNEVGGATYADLSLIYRPRVADSMKKIEIFAKVDNVTDRNPPAVGSHAANSYVDPGVNPQLYDTIGRSFRAGVRVQW